MGLHEERFMTRVAVYLIVVKDNQILLALRKNTGFADGLYSLPSGHLEKDETIAHAMIREAQEEIGIRINPEDLKLVHVMQHKSHFYYIDFYFRCDHFQGNPLNCEPEKCGEVKFFAQDQLPENLVGNVRQALEYVAQNSLYSDFGLKK